MLGLIIGIGSTYAVGSLAARSSGSALQSQAALLLEAVRDGRKDQIENYFVGIHEQILNFSQNQMVAEATRDFSASFQTVAKESALDAGDNSALTRSIHGYYDGQFRPRADKAGITYRGAAAYTPADANARVLQTWYIANYDNPSYDVGDKLSLDRAQQDVSYNRFHAQYHPQIRRFLLSFGYYDIFLFDTEGNLIYSVYKETDYTTNFANGPYAQTNFARVVKDALAAQEPGQIFVEDFAAYEPSYGNAASFISAPVFHEGQRIGCAVFQMPVDAINSIMQQAAGLGETGETFLIASDHRMRSNSRFSGNGPSTILSQEVQTEPAQATFNGETGTMTADDYQGDQVISAYAPLQFSDPEGKPIKALNANLPWAILAEQNTDELIQPANALAIQIMLIGVGIAIVVAAASLLFAISLTKPIKALVERSRQIASGDLTGEPLKIKANDEIGQVTDATNQMSDSLGQLVSEMAQSSDNVAAAATQIAASSEEMSAGMQNQTDQITLISAAVEEMSASCIEVARKSADAANAATQAGTSAKTGGEVVNQTIDGMQAINQAVDASATSVRELGKLGENIGQVIDVINDIADQTNLLALNAAIEAARAGEHGRGFAVVADEVRKLADRTTKATEEVAQSITAIQTGTVTAVERMETGASQVQTGVKSASEAGEMLDQIVTSADNVSSMIQSIAAAAEEQSAASEEVSRNTEQIASVAQEAGQGASEAAAAATDLSEKAEQMRALVTRFKVKH